MASLAVTHQPDARVRAGRPHDRDRPGEAAGRHVAAKPHFDVAQASRRQFHLGRLKEHGWQAHAETSLDRVLSAARQHAGATPDDRAVVKRDGNPSVFHPGAQHPGPRDDGGSSPASGVKQSAIKGEPIHDHRLDIGGRVFDRRAGRREEPGRAERVQDDLAGEAELIEGFDGQHARAVHGVAAGGVLFVDRDIEAVSQPADEPFRGRQGRRR